VEKKSQRLQSFFKRNNSMSEDSYFTIRHHSTNEIKIKGSRFIGNTKPVKNRDEADGFIAKISKQHHAATHNCFAYRIGCGSKTQTRFNDDGEPSGTAGRPILEVMTGRELTNLVCVVTRYFSGTKLGTGGLARAYTRCAAEALDKSGRKENYLTVSMELIFPYTCTGTVMSLLSSRKCRVVEKAYNALTSIMVVVRKSIAQKLQQDLTNATAGKIQIRLKGVANH